VATSGSLDNVPVPEVQRFEKEFLQYVETSHGSILKSIASKKALDDAIKAEVKNALDAFKERFTAVVAAAAK
jgi:F-type H+-transporting ATPase subunit alpha